MVLKLKILFFSPSSFFFLYCNCKRTPSFKSPVASNWCKIGFYLLCSSSYKMVTNDLQTLQLPYKQREWAMNQRHLIHRLKSSLLDSHKPWLIRLCSPTLLVVPCTDLLCKWTRLVLENPISSWPQGHRHSLFHYFVQRERERDIYIYIYMRYSSLFFFLSCFGFWVWKRRVMGGWFEGSFLHFSPFFLIFC